MYTCIVIVIVIVIINTACLERAQSGDVNSEAT